MPTQSELQNKLESVLFSLGRKLSLEELGRLCKEQDLELIKQALADLGHALDAKSSSLMLVQEADTYKFAVREKYLGIVRKVVKKTELPKTVLETLAVVAFKAPVLQSKVINVRTNKAYDHLRMLEETGYVTREKSGRTKLIKLTKKFFDYFDIPPEQLKQKFGNSAQIEQAIAAKEVAIAQETGIAPQNEGADTLGVLELYAPEQQQAEVKSEETKTPDVEVYKEQLGELDVYETEKQQSEAKKDSQKKSVEQDIQEPTVNNEVTGIEDSEIKNNTLEEQPEAPEQTPVQEAEETNKGTDDQEQNEEAPSEQESPVAAIEGEESTVEDNPTQEPETEQEPSESAEPESSEGREFEGEGLFPKGLSDEMREKVDKRVTELLEGEKQEEDL